MTCLVNYCPGLDVLYIVVAMAVYLLGVGLSIKWVDRRMNRRITKAERAAGMRPGTIKRW